MNLFSWFYVHLMYIKVISVLELFKGIVTIVIIALEPSIFPRSFHLFSVVTVVRGARVEVEAVLYVAIKSYT